MIGWSIYFTVLYQQHFLLWLLFSGILGLIIGSFINVVVYRLPIMLEKVWQEEAKFILGVSSSAFLEKTYNLLYPSSHCINCHHAIRWFDNIPLLSWLILRGRCRDCQTKISIRYPLIELLTAIITMIICSFITPSLFLVATLIFSWYLLIAAFIDAEKLLLPDCLTLSFLWLGLFFNLYGGFTSLDDAVKGAIIGYMVLWFVNTLFKFLYKKEGLGHGDFKLLAALGAWLGWHYIINIILLASVSGIIITSVLILFRVKSAKQPIAFGVYLSFAGWLIMICNRTDYWLF